MKAMALVATRKGLFKVMQDKSIEIAGFEGVPVSMVLAEREKSKWYVALDHGHFGVKLHRSIDQGQSWQEINCPCYPPVELNSDDEKGGDSLSLIWSMAYADQSGDKLWVGTIPGGLFFSEDAGQNWQLNQALWQHKLKHEWFGGGFDQAGIHSICVDPRNDQEIKVAVSCAGIWTSKNGGKEWQNTSTGMRAAYMPPEKSHDIHIQDPHLLVQCQAKPDNFWVQHHNGIFYSNDNAQSWQEIEHVDPSVFGFATAVHPQDPDIAWFVPGIKDECRIPVDGKFVVTRTRDGGKTFEILSNGLPTGPSYDLVFRHGLAINQTGNSLMMGSTTGNLWMTEDQGDKWQCLSNYLPPIYAVRYL